MGLEADVERRACHDAYTHYGIKNIKLGQDGWPDRMFLIPKGRPLLIEFKAPGEEPKPRQEERHQYLRNLGYDIEVHDTYTGAMGAITRALEAARLSKKGNEVRPRTRMRRPVP